MPPNYLDPAALARQTAGAQQNSFNAQRRDGVVGPSSGRPDWAQDTGGGAMRAGMFGNNQMPGRASTMPAMPAQGGAPMMRQPTPMTPPIMTPAGPPGGAGPQMGGPGNVGYMRPPPVQTGGAQMAGGIPSGQVSVAPPSSPVTPTMGAPPPVRPM